MVKNPRVAILILNYRQPNLTVSCVKSVLENTYQNYKVFLIDNHSQDDSKEIFLKEFDHHPQIKLLQTKANFGYGGGNNYAAREALKRGSFDYFCILNNDTLVDKNFLKTLINSCKILGKENIYFPLILSWQTNVVQNGGLKDFLPTPFQFNHSGKEAKTKFRTEALPFLGGCCFLVKASIFQKAGGFREDFFMYTEDVDFGIRAKRSGIKLYLIPKSKIWHKGSSSFSPSSIYYMARNTMYLIRERSDRKKCDYLRACFWFTLIAVMNFFLADFKSL